jgi:hypothetical protein
MTANGFPDEVICGARTETARVGQKARIHSGTVKGKQPQPAALRLCRDGAVNV